jgi:hypothetical protein
VAIFCKSLQTFRLLCKYNTTFRGSSKRGSTPPLTRSEISNFSTSRVSPSPHVTFSCPFHTKTPANPPSTLHSLHSRTNISIQTNRHICAMSSATSDAVHPARPRSSHVAPNGLGNKFLKTNSVGVIGCPFSGGQPRAGVDTGPHHLIDFGLLNQIEELGYKVSFGGHQQFAQVMQGSKDDDPDVGKLKRPKYVGNVTRALKQSVEETCKRGELALTLGGDHSLAIGTVSGVFSAYPDACLIWIDAVNSSPVET